MADPEISKGGGAPGRKTMHQLRRHLSQMHRNLYLNELYAFYTGKGDLLKKIAEANWGGGAPTTIQFESATHLTTQMSGVFSDFSASLLHFCAFFPVLFRFTI